MKTLVWMPVVLLLVAGGFGSASGQTVTLLYSFGGGDGMDPAAPLVQGSDGNFYGTTFAGGASTNCNTTLPVFPESTTGCGTVFQISPAGTLTTLYSFSGSDGANPMGALMQGNDGNFYGTTYQGGSNSAGTVFRISSSGTFASIHSFNGGDGRYPYAGLLRGSDGNFYGTTYQGGSTSNGNVFRITAVGICTNLHSFSGSDGLRPRGGLALGIDGNFYGTTFLGGTNLFPICAGGCGTVFRISPSGNFTNLHSFIHTDGSQPDDSLVQGSDGLFYGTTSAGDCPGICDGENGVVFRISAQGDFAKIFSFVDTATSASNHAYVPFAGLIQGSDGLFYGTTPGGSKIYRINPVDDTIDVYPLGANSTPFAGVIQGADGAFYGTSMWGGSNSNCINGCGAVYKLSVPLGPAPYPINQITNVQVVATNAIFQVVSVFGETYQLQFSPTMNPTNWGNVAGVSVTNSIGALMTLTNFGGASAPQGFYRFDVTP